VCVVIAAVRNTRTNRRKLRVTKFKFLTTSYPILYSRSHNSLSLILFACLPLGPSCARHRLATEASLTRWRRRYSHSNQRAEPFPPLKRVSQPTSPHIRQCLVLHPHSKVRIIALSYAPPINLLTQLSSPFRSLVLSREGASF
jgi:hypothetical protein